MSDIPSEVLRDILLRLPAESLFPFRSVCKAWRRIIDDPSFIKSHTNNQHSSTTLLIRNEVGTPIYYMSLDSLNYADASQVIDATHVKTLMRRNVPRLPTLPAASCNGLILISHYDIKKIWVIWNPLSREFHKLPETDINVRLIGSGLGYDCAADDYKVVRIDQLLHRKTLYQTCIYSLKLDSWKMIKDFPCDLPWGDQGVFLNGALHWRSWDLIIVLGLGTEDYHQLPLPPVRCTTPSDIYLDALGGSLVVSCFFSIWRFDGWVMKDDGMEKSWTKLFSFGDDSHIIGAMWNLRPIAYFKGKGQVLLQHDSKFFWLDIEKNSVKKFTVQGLPNSFTSQICPGSLFRLEDSCDDSGNVAEITQVGATRKRKRPNRRLKLSVTITDIWCCSDSSCSSVSCWSSEGED